MGVTDDVHSLAYTKRNCKYFFNFMQKTKSSIFATVAYMLHFKKNKHNF